MAESQGPVWQPFDHQSSLRKVSTSRGRPEGLVDLQSLVVVLSHHWTLPQRFHNQGRFYHSLHLVHTILLLWNSGGGKIKLPLTMVAASDDIGTLFITYMWHSKSPSKPSVLPWKVLTISSRGSFISCRHLRNSCIKFPCQTRMKIPCQTDGIDVPRPRHDQQQHDLVPARVGGPQAVMITRLMCPLFDFDFDQF